MEVAAPLAPLRVYLLDAERDVAAERAFDDTYADEVYRRQKKKKKTSLLIALYSLYQQ